MVDLENLQIDWLIEEALAGAPEAGILFLFYSVRQSNTKSGRNTSDLHQIPLSSLPSTAIQDLAAITTAFPNIAAQALVNTLGAISGITALPQIISAIKSGLGL